MTFAFLNFAGFAADHFAQAEQLRGEGPLLIEGDLRNATVEPGEPSTLFTWLSVQPLPAERSLWWSWIAPRDCDVVLDPSASPLFDKSVAVFQGDTLAELTAIGGSYWDSRFLFRASANRTYRIVVSSTGPSEAVVGTLATYASPANDQWANALPVSGKSFVLSGSNLGATMEAGEPPDGFQRTLWWKWTPPADGRLFQQTSAAHGFQIFIGDSVNGLAEASPDWNQVNAGTNYYLRVFGEPGPFSLQLALDTTHVTVSPAKTNLVEGEELTIQLFPDPDLPAPAEMSFRAGEYYGATNPFVVAFIPLAGRHEVSPLLSYSDATDRLLRPFPLWVRPRNDLFADALEIPPDGGQVMGTTFNGSSVEPGEPGFAEQPTVGSVWWKWRPSKSGRIIVRHAGLFFRMFRGNTLAALEELSSSDPSGIESVFEVNASDEYRLVVYASLNTGPGFLLEFAEFNDDFASASVLTGMASADARRSTSETGEPAPNAQRSLWWEWTSPGAGWVEITLTNALDLLRIGDFHVPLQVFRGTKLSDLVPAAPTANRFFAPVQAGEKLFLRASTDYGTQFYLKAAFTPEAGNDAFADRIRASTVPYYTNLFVSGVATGTEPGEPQVSAGHTLWWEWTPRFTGRVAIQAWPNAAIGVFTGTELGALTPAVGQTNRHGAYLLWAVEGQPFQIQMSTTSPSEKHFYIATPETNRTLASAKEIRSASEPFAGTFYDPSVEGPGGRAPELWWKWIAPADGLLQVRGHGTALALLRVFTLNSLGGTQTVQTVSNPWVPGVEFRHVIKDETYYLQWRNIDSLGVNNSAAGLAVTMKLTSARLSEPVHGAEYKYRAPLRVAVPDLQTEYDGPATRASVHVRMVESASYGFNDLRYEFPSSPFEFVTTNFPPGIFEAYTVVLSTNGEPSHSVPIRFSVGAPNDDFANRYLTGLPYHPSELFVGASLEPGEAAFFPTNVIGSLWWEWTSPVNGIVRLDRRSDMAVFAGTNLSTLNPVVASGVGSITFRAEAGQRYQIAGLRSLVSTGEVTLQLFAPRTNDTFALAEHLNWAEGSRVETYYPFVQSSLEPGEPAAPEGKGSLWFRLSYEHDVHFDFKPGFGIALEIFSGEEVSNLQPVPDLEGLEGYRRAFLPAGRPYFLRALGDPARAGESRVEFRWFKVAANDHFANAISLSGSSAAFNAFSLGATVEPGEPGAGQVQGSVWWSWVAPADGALDIWHDQHPMEVFTGSTLEALQRLAPQATHDDLKTYAVRNGERYSIRSVRPPFTPQAGPALQLNFNPGWPVANDAFASRTQITGPSLRITAKSAGATPEPEERPVNGRGSVWWEWTAPSAGIATIRPLTNCSFAVYRGDNLGTLEFASPIWTDPVGVAVAAGDKLQIAIYRGRAEDLEWSLELTPFPDYDRPEKALVVSGASVTFPINPRQGPGYMPGTWVKWQAPVGGNVTLRNLSNGGEIPFDLNLQLANGELKEQRTVDWNFPRRVVAGRTYLIFILLGTPEILELRVEPTALPDVDLQVSAEATVLMPSALLAIPIRVDVSENLRNWLLLGTFPAGHSPVLLEANPTNLFRFYRITPLR